TPVRSGVRAGSDPCTERGQSGVRPCYGPGSDPGAEPGARRAAGVGDLSAERDSLKCFADEHLEAAALAFRCVLELGEQLVDRLALAWIEAVGADLAQPPVQLGVAE